MVPKFGVSKSGEGMTATPGRSLYVAPPLAAFFFFQAEDGIRVLYVTGVQTCALPIFDPGQRHPLQRAGQGTARDQDRSEEHTSELQSRRDLVCRLLLEKKKKRTIA